MDTDPSQLNASQSLHPQNDPFLLPIEDVFALKGHGIVATGRITRGRVKVGDALEIIGLRQDIRSVVVAGIEMPGFKKIDALLDYYRSGACGIYLRDLERADVERGQVLAAPGTIRPYSLFTARVHFSPTQGARQQPFFNAYRSSIHIWTTDVFATLWLPKGTTAVHLDDQMDVDVELNTPVALEVGTEFGIGRLLGTGIVTELIA